MRSASRRRGDQIAGWAEDEQALRAIITNRSLKL
jgi:hypothetical protein